MSTNWKVILSVAGLLLVALVGFGLWNMLTAQREAPTEAKKLVDPTKGKEVPQDQIPDVVRRLTDPDAPVKKNGPVDSTPGAPEIDLEIPGDGPPVDLGDPTNGDPTETDPPKKEPPPSERTTAELLSQLGDPLQLGPAADELKDRGVEVIPLLAKRLASGDPQVRAGAAYALSLFGPEAQNTLPALEKAHQRETDPQLKARIAYAIDAVKGE